jgi:hypothetical protein
MSRTVVTHTFTPGEIRMSITRRFAMVAALFCLASPLVPSLSAQTTLRDSSDVNAPSATEAVPGRAEGTSPIGFEAPLTPVGVTQPRAAVNGVATVRTALATHVAAADDSRSSHSVPLMIVGGAALLVGGIVGGKAGGAIMVGGAVVGLAGLWRYLQ